MKKVIKTKKFGGTMYKLPPLPKDMRLAPGMIVYSDLGKIEMYCGKCGKLIKKSNAKTTRK